MERDMMEDKVLELYEQTFSQRFHRCDLATLQQMQASLEEAYKAFHGQQETRIENMIQAERNEVRSQQAKQRAAHFKYVAAKSRINTKITEISELMDPPTFSGEQRDWQDWVSQFKDYIQENQGLSEGEKLTMLKKALNDNDRRKLCGGFYESFQLLVKSYDGIYAATMNLFDELFQIPTFHGEASAALFELSLIANRFVRKFRALGAPVSSWEPLFIHFVKTRMPAETHLAWENVRARNEMPNLSQLLNFY